ncbi:MAG: lysophospholipid acyltransferase family protein [Solirubrobacteraceae bacterium]|nr:lysophospholipid acyltransferase family protein [Solirubrobacteraceae bacterium]
MAGPLLLDDSPVGERWARRARGIGVEVLALVVVTVALPFLLAGGLVVDAVLAVVRRKPATAARLVLMLWWFLAIDLLALSRVIVIRWSTLGRDTPGRRRRLNRARIWWTSHLLAGVRVLFRLRIEVEDVEQAGPGPVILLMRHASIIDNTLPDAIASRAHGYTLRYVIKRELRMVPTLDIGGELVPTFYVRRDSGDTARELERLRLLAVDLGPDDGVLIYPEGTRKTEAKLARAKEIIRERRPELAERVERFRHVLPPRPGGPLVVLEDAQDVDVVLCGHVGFDGFRSVGDVWRGRLIGTTIRIRFWRIPAAEVPRDADERLAWLYDRWLEVDAWVGEQHALLGDVHD